VAQSIVGRVAQLARANINSLIDGAEDPQKMLDQMVRDYTSAIEDARNAVAQTIGELRLTEDDLREAKAAALEWGEKATAASRRADTATDSAEAERYNNLARLALQKQLGQETTAKTLQDRVTHDTEVVNTLKDGLGKMEIRLGELKSKREEILARAKMASAQIRVQKAVTSVSATDPTSELSRFEDRVRQQEAQARGLEEIASNSLEEQFASLDHDKDNTEVEARLAALKQRTPAGVA
jgi:phage shock protein A